MLPSYEVNNHNANSHSNSTGPVKSDINEVSVDKNDTETVADSPALNAQTPVHRERPTSKPQVIKSNNDTKIRSTGQRERGLASTVIGRLETARAYSVSKLLTFSEKRDNMSTKKQVESSRTCKYVRCAFFSAFFLLGASIFANVYQMIIGNCEALKNEIFVLGTLNQELAEGVNRLDLQNNRLTGEIKLFNETKTQLSKEVKILSNSNNKMNESVTALRSLSRSLKDMIDDPSLTYNAFRRGVQGSIVSLHIETNTTLHILKDMQNELMETQISLKQLEDERIILSHLYTSEVDDTNGNLLGARHALLETISLVLKGSSEDYTSDTFSEIVLRAVDVFFSNSSKASLYEVEQEKISFTQLQKVLHELRNQSFVIAPNLYLPHLLNTES